MNSSNLTEDYFYNIFQSKSFESLTEEEAYYLVTEFEEDYTREHCYERNYYDTIVKLNNHFYLVPWSFDEDMGNKEFEWKHVYEVIPKEVATIEWRRKE